jgi:hypothetical protein
VQDGRTSLHSAGPHANFCILCTTVYAPPTPGTLDNEALIYFLEDSFFPPLIQHTCFTVPGNFDLAPLLQKKYNHSSFTDDAYMFIVSFFHLATHITDPQENGKKYGVAIK